jgi:MSHA pilin protein MshA
MRTLQKGFTLIELIVVIVILGILAAVAIPQFTDLSSQAKVAVGQAACGALQTSAVMFYASNKAATPYATITAATTVQSGTTVTGNFGGNCGAPVFNNVDTTTITPCTPIPTAFCS